MVRVGEREGRDQREREGSDQRERERGEIEEVDRERERKKTHLS